MGTALAAAFLLAFGVSELLRVPVLTDARPLPDEGSWLVALAGLVLLVADVVLPVPASGVMLAHGAAFGLWPGALLSLIGGTLATLTAFLVGRRSRRWVDRLVPADRQRRGEEFIQRHGLWVLVASRPVPVVAETVAIMAGTTSVLSWGRVTVAGAVGNVVPAVAYAAAGSAAASSVNGMVVVLAVLALGAAVWLLTSRNRAEAPDREARDQPA